MPDIYLSAQLIFSDVAGVARLGETFEVSEDDESTNFFRLQTGVSTIDAVEVATEGFVNDNGYVEIELALGAWLEAKVFAEWLETYGPDVVCVSVFDESCEDESNHYRVGGKAVRGSVALKRIEKAAPAYQAYYLIYDGKTEKLKRLLDDGLDVNARAYKQPLLTMAAKHAYKYPETVDLLLEYGADPNAPGCHISWEPGDGPAEYESPLYVVSRIRPKSDGNEAAVLSRVLRALIAAGADPENGGPDAELTPLQEAAANEAYPQVEVLLENGADPDRVTEEYSFSPLSIAAYTYRTYPSDNTRQILCQLVSAGARTAITDIKSHSTGDVFDAIPELRAWIDAKG